MKKFLLIIMLSAGLLTSCKKEGRSPCYHCTFGTYNGQNYPDKDYCGFDIDKHHFTDGAGNDLSSNCILIP